MFLRGRGIGASSLTFASGNAAPTGQLSLPSFKYLLEGRQRRRPEIDEIEHR